MRPSIGRASMVALLTALPSDASVVIERFRFAAHVEGDGCSLHRQGDVDRRRLVHQQFGDRGLRGEAAAGGGNGIRSGSELQELVTAGWHPLVRSAWKPLALFSRETEAPGTPCPAAIDHSTAAQGSKGGLTVEYRDRKQKEEEPSERLHNVVLMINSSATNFSFLPPGVRGKVWTQAEGPAVWPSRLKILECHLLHRLLTHGSRDLLAGVIEGSAISPQCARRARAAEAGIPPVSMTYAPGWQCCVRLPKWGA